MNDVSNDEAEGRIRRSWVTWTRVILAGIGATGLLAIHAVLAFNAFVRPLAWMPFGVPLVAVAFVACVVAGLLALPAWNRWAFLALPSAIGSAVVNQVFARMTAAPAWPTLLIWLGIGWYWIGPVLTVALAVAAAVGCWRAGAELVVVPNAADEDVETEAPAESEVGPAPEPEPGPECAPEPAPAPEPPAVAESEFFDVE